MLHVRGLAAASILNAEACRASCPVLCDTCTGGVITECFHGATCGSQVHEHMAEHLHAHSDTFRVVLLRAGSLICGRHGMACSWPRARSSAWRLMR